MAMNMTSFVLLDSTDSPDVEVECKAQTCNIYPVSDIKGTARAVFSLLVRNSSHIEIAKHVVEQLNQGRDLSRLEAFGKGKVSTATQWQHLESELSGINFFEVVSSSGFPATLERAKGFDLRSRSGLKSRTESWYVIVKNDMKGKARPLFSFSVHDETEAGLVLRFAEILNREDRPNISQLPLQKKGKVSSQKDYLRFVNLRWG